MTRILSFTAGAFALALVATGAPAAPQAEDEWRNFTVLGVLGVTLGAYSVNADGETEVNPRAHRQVYRNVPALGRFDEAGRNQAIVPPYYGGRRYDPRRQFGPLYKAR